MNNQGLRGLPYVVVAAAILQREGRILLTRRKLDAHQGGLWEFPGGKQEVGETLEQCLRRELKEEIDIEVGTVKPFSVLRYHYPEKEVELHFFTCSTFQGDPKPLGSIEMAWVPKGELTFYEFPAADRPVVEKILQGQLEEEFSS
jgi:8-oxo-dGTP diphosphatase